ncbi:MAG: DUF1501 domain-containing protein [Planctomycetes bacterium]|nr:DUF1501 domain-containing protein [Planctomycetota bacterium]
MLTLSLNRQSGHAGPMGRRSFLKLGASGLAGFSLADIARARSAASSSASDTSVILLWLDGGPSHMDLYDMKPDAPAEYRGIWKPIRTNVPGMDMTELFPRQAKTAHRMSIIRSLHHGTGDHFGGGHRILTAKDMGVSGANNAPKFPSLGAIASMQLGPRRTGMPAYVGLPNASSIGLVPGYFGGHFLGKAFDPFMPGGDPNSPRYSVKNLDLAGGLSLEKLDDRRSLQQRFDKVSAALDRSETVRAMDKFDQQAIDFVRGAAARTAFQIDREDVRLRDRYGRTSWGQSALVARRLVEAGSTFVTLTYGGWDHHWDLQKGMENYLPQVDTAVSALLEDLDERGMLEKTLVMVMGEFSRTPKMNDGGNGGPPRSMGTPGRDHWGNAMFCVMAGGGVQGGRIVGSTEKLGQAPKSRPVTPAQLHATVYKVLGIPNDLMLTDPTGRPVSPIEQAKPVDELF